MTELEQSNASTSSLGTQACPACGHTYPADTVRCHADGTLLPHWVNLIGRTVADRYIVEDLIAVGGMAVVYQARQRIVNRSVALKILRTKDQVDDAHRRLFFAEARVISRLRHPNIVTLFDFGQLRDNRFFMALEYIDGQSLSSRLEKGPLPLPEVIDIGAALCAALDEAHRLGVVHRDVKPDNVMLQWMNGQWSIRLVDFGIAQHTVSGLDDKIRLGTPEYASPEVLTGQPIDYRSDLYALGLILFEMATGTTPFTGDLKQIAQHHATSEAPRTRSVAPHLDIDEQFDILVAQLLTKEPDERPSSAGVVAKRLRSIVSTSQPDELQGDDTVLARSQSATTHSTSAGLSPIPNTRKSMNETRKRNTSPLGSAVRGSEGMVRAQLPRWRYIVVLGLVSAAAIGLVQLQKLTQEGLSDGPRPSLRAIDKPATRERMAIPRERIRITDLLGQATLDNFRPPPIPADQKTDTPYVLFNPENLNVLGPLPTAPQSKDANDQGRFQFLRTGLRLWREINQAYNRSYSKYRDDRRRWEDGLRKTRPIRPTLNYGPAIRAFESAIAAQPSHRTVPVLLSMLVHGYSVNGQLTRARDTARRIMRQYDPQTIPVPFKGPMADFAFDENALSYARALFLSLIDGADRQRGTYARFMLAFIDYAEGAYSSALKRGFDMYEKLKENRDAYPVLAPEILPLVILTSVRLHQPPSSIRLYLRAQGGGELERNYLPLLAAALEANAQWALASEQYRALLTWRRPEESDTDRQEWVLAQLRIDDQLARHEEVVNTAWSEVIPCAVFTGRPNRRGRCLVILGRALTRLEAFNEAKLVLNTAKRIGEYPDLATDMTLKNWKYEALLRLHDLECHLATSGASGLTVAHRGQSFERTVRAYENFLDSAPAHWQAVAYDRLARLYESRIRILTNARNRRADSAMAQALRERGGLRLNTSPKGIDWMLKQAP